MHYILKAIFKKSELYRVNSLKEEKKNNLIKNLPEFMRFGKLNQAILFQVEQQPRL